MAGEEIIVRVEALLQGGRAAEAARLLESAAEAGQAAALVRLASWRIAGNVVRRDLAKARSLLAAAGERGDSGAALLHASFLASGTGGEADWPAALAALRRLAPKVPQAAAQLCLIDAMALDGDGYPQRPGAVRPLSTAPRAAVAESFLTAAECAYLRAAAEPELQPSVVVDPATGRMAPHPVRTSDAAMFGVHGEDLVVNAVNRRIAASSGTRPAQGEPLQVLRYRPGGEYKPHFDALPAEGNQRILTCLIYLSDGYEGGETHFPRAGLTFRGRTGDALLFRNTAADGRADPLSLHAGLPVTRGTKYLASRWIRSERFTYPPPKPLLDL
ncbi:MAG TPA: 2OG-Fe(II) oxygenase [Allosphingosinicella sp.]|jgi:prolyl 4-hydroxylase|nr:2OG-Fe(II) oxygenase [Allosphingosinicella sp.]